MNADDALDARRYRWLRHGDNDEFVMRMIDGSPVPVMDPDETAPCFLLRNEKLDAEIDRQMAIEADRVPVPYTITEAGRKALEGRK